MEAVFSDRLGASLRQPPALDIGSIAMSRLTGLIAGGTLLAAGATIAGNAGSFPHPWHQALTALLTSLLGIAAMAGGALLIGRRPTASLALFGTFAFVIATLPLARYIPLFYTVAYERDLESFFPPVWAYSVSLPVLVALVADLALSRRARTASALVVAMSLLPAALLLLLGTQVVSAMASTLVFVAVPMRTLLAYASCVGLSVLIVLSTVAATRGMVLIGVVALLGTGLFLEVGSIFFYGGLPRRWVFDFVFNPYPFWVPFLGGTVAGALTVLTSLAVLWARTPSRDY